MFKGKSLVVFVLICTLVFSFSGFSIAGEGNKLRVAVLGFADNGSKDSLGKVITEQLNFALAKFNRFTLADSAQVQKVMNETGIALVNNIDNSKMDYFKNTANVDVIIYGTVSSLGSDSFFVDVKLFDMRKGKIKNLESYSFGKAIEVPGIAQKIVGKLGQEFPLSGLVAKVSENQIYINLGSEAGAKLGDTYVVYREGESIKDPATGKVIGIEKTELAKVKIKNIEAEYAIAEIIEPMTNNKIVVSDKIVQLVSENAYNVNPSEINVASIQSNQTQPIQDASGRKVSIANDKVEQSESLAKKEIEILGVQPKFVSFSPNGKNIVYCNDDGSVVLLDAATGSGVANYNINKASVTSVNFSADQKYMATADANGKVVVWDLDRNQKYKELDTDVVSKSTYGSDHNRDINCIVVFLRDNKLIVTSNSSVAIWDIKKEKKVRSFDITRETTTIALSPDGKNVATGGRDGKIRLWDLNNGRQLSVFGGHQRDITTLAFAPDGKTLASGSIDREVKLWSIGTGKEIRTLTGNNDSITSVVFSPDAKNIATGSKDGIIRIWEADTGNELTRMQHKSVTKFLGMKVERSTVLSLAYSPDGKTIASLGSYDIKLWECNKQQKAI